MAHDVFISYSSKDKAIADAICAALESNGIKCWMAPRDISAGSYGAAIVKAIGSSKMVVLVLSANANQSQHVIKEMERAVSKRKFIYPIRVEEVIPSEDLELFISSEHWLDAFTQPIEDHLYCLVANVRQQLGTKGAQFTHPTQKPIRSILKINPVQIFVTIGILVTLIGGLWLLQSLWRTDGTDEAAAANTQSNPDTLRQANQNTRAVSESVDVTWLNGTWEGTAYQTNAKSNWGMILVAQNNKYLIEYPSISCEGEWFLVSIDSNKAELRENITVQSELCEDNGTVFIDKINDFQIGYRYKQPEDVEVTSSATLSKIK